MTTKICFFGVLLLFSLVSCAEASSATPTASVATAVPTHTPAPTATVTAESLTELGPFAVGTRDMTYVDEDRDSQEMIIKMWYPAKDNTGDAAPDLGGAPYPVVIYSHGGYYDGFSHRNAHSSLALHLASHGFVVVGLEHNDVDHAEAFTDRPLDILSVIGQLDYLAENEFAGVLDMEKLGVMGMSLGTATTMQMGGAHLDFENATAWCAAHPDTYLCPPDPSVPERSRALMAEVGMVDENGLNYIPTDPRIRAVALMSPAFAPMYGERGLQSVNVPVLLLAGAHSEFYEDGEISSIYQHLGSPERYLISFTNGDHGYLLAPRLRAREQLMAAFWGYYLQGRQDYAQFLTEAYVNSVPGLAWGVYDVGDNTESATAGRDVITSDNVDHLQQLATFEQDTVCTATFSSDGKLLASSGVGAITLQDIVDGKILNTLSTEYNNVYDVSFSPNATLLAATAIGNCGQTNVRVWDVTSGELLLQRLDEFEHMATGVALSPDGAVIAAGTGCVFDEPGSASVKVWDTASGTLLLDIAMPSFVTDVTFSPDGTLLAAAAGDGIIRLWEVETGTLRTELHGHLDSVSSIAFSPDSTRLASGGTDARLWDVASGEQLYLFEEPAGEVIDVAFSMDGRLIGASVNRALVFWDTATGATLAEWEVGNEGNYINSVAFNADNTLLATCEHDEMLRLWGIPAPPETME